MARNWAKFGVAVPKSEEKIGDVLVFLRGSGGHVGFYVAESQYTFYVYGANQGNRFSIVEIAKSRLIACRRPHNLAPSGVQKYILCGLASYPQMRLKYFFSCC
jgi:hypothetical protein